MHRDQLWPCGEPLPEGWKVQLRSYFSDTDLSRVRIVVADPLPISRAPFAHTLRRLGFRFPDVRLVGGIVFDDVIALREQPSARLLCHEMVHVVQYWILGVRGFARAYVTGFVRARCYDDIPLERCAYDFDARFASSRNVFSMEDEVRQWLKAGPL